MNKKLVAQFLASVDSYTLPTNDYELDELDEFEVQEIIEQSVKFEHNGNTLYVIPGVTFVNGVQTIDCYELRGYKLIESDYVPTYSELSDILEEQGWTGDWVDSNDVTEAMKHIPKDDEDE